VLTILKRVPGGNAHLMWMAISDQQRHRVGVFLMRRLALGPSVPEVAANRPFGGSHRKPNEITAKTSVYTI